MKHLFITCIPGFETTLQRECQNLGYEAIIGKGGVYCPYRDFEQIYKLNLWLRSASRVLLPIARFALRHGKDLYKEALKIDWVRYFRNMPTFAIDAQSFHPDLKNSLFASQVVKDALCDTLRKHSGRRPNVDTKHPDIRLNLFVEQAQATISFDTSGDPLNMRGYRAEGGVAPLREHLAASLLLEAGYSGNELMIDPCCGSGTFLIEAAFIAKNIAPGLMREQFGFMSHPYHSPSKWQEVLEQARSKQRPLAGKIAGIENNSETFEVLKNALARAKVDRDVTIVLGDFRESELPFNPNFIIANPPYGVRLDDEEALVGLYKSLGDFMKKKSLKPALGAIFTASDILSKKIGLQAKRRFRVNNGGLECRFLIFDLYQKNSAPPDEKRD